jgi:hypothetical protein
MFGRKRRRTQHDLMMRFDDAWLEEEKNVV